MSVDEKVALRVYDAGERVVATLGDMERAP